MVVLFLLMTVIIALTIDYAVQLAARRRQAAQQARASAETAAPAVAIAPRLPAPPPPGVLVTPSHAWWELDPTGSVRVGADALAMHALGEVDAVTLPNAGDQIAAGQPLATLRRGKRELRLASPVAGVVTRANHQLACRPTGLQQRPYGDHGWLCTIQPSRLVPALRMSRVAEEAEAWTKREVGRMRDTLVAVLATPETAMTAADGGIPAPGFAAELDEARWTAFADAFFGETEDRNTERVDQESVAARTRMPDTDG